MRNRYLLSFYLLVVLLFSVTTSLVQASGQMPVMDYIDVGEKANQSLRISKLIMGTDHLGKIPNEKTIEVLNEAVKLGINTFDTAPIYTDSIEVRFGNWLKSLNRSDLHVITKGGFPRDLGPGTYFGRLKGTKEQITANVFEEIQRSKANYNNKIAIYLMHRDDMEYRDYKKVERPLTPVKTILEGLSDPLLRKNYTMLGVSNWETGRINESQKVAAENPNLVRPVVNSPYFSLLEMGSGTIHSGGVQVKHEDMMNPDFQKGVKLMTYSPLGGFSIFSKGWETAKKNALELKNKNDRYWGHVYDAIFTEANEKRFMRAIEFTKNFNEKHKTNYTLDQIAMAYVIAHPRTDFVIIGPRSVEQIRRTVQALEVAKLLTKEDLDYLYTGSAITGSNHS
ncbi:MAG: aldo/keto reductase [Candidatus Riflebacteria bacterium]|nr:aldo/keto reductase [Candidatus Riflebacteria bacterium]